MSMTLGELAVRFGCQLRGDPALRVDHVAGLSSAGEGALSFLVNPRLKPELAATRATAVVLAARALADCPVAALIDPNPHAAFARMAALLHPASLPQPGVHPSAVVHPQAAIDPSAEVGPLCVIGPRVHIAAHAQIGPGCILGPHVVVGAGSRLVSSVTLAHGVQLGERVLIHPGAVIGADGFGLARDGDRWLKVPQLGSVRLGDDV
jgi:UDP-3-O-[3-hydroxymyristoyl] glucosamine N-acyltransferase